MTKVKVKQIDTFTIVPHAGNPAGVVLDGKDLTDQQMQTIARELCLSETAFLLPSTKPGTDLRIRWFTPTHEVPICSHATIASFHALAEEKLLGIESDGEYHFRIDTASGILPIDVFNKNGSTRIMLGSAVPRLTRAGWWRVELVRLLNITPREIVEDIPMLKDRYLYVPIHRLHSLFAMQPNFLLIANFLSSRQLDGLCVYTHETIDRESIVHSRFFAPHRGVNEDPVTGSAHGPLAIILHTQGALDVQDGRCAFQAEQGDIIGRKGRIQVELEVIDDVPVAVKVGGNAVTVLEGEMVLHD